MTINKILVLLVTIIISFCSCSKDSVNTSNTPTNTQIIDQATNALSSNIYIGNSKGKLQWQATLGDPLVTTNLLMLDTLSFNKYGLTSDSNFTIIENANTGTELTMKLIDSNFANEYLVYCYGQLNYSEYVAGQFNSKDHYCTLSGTGPEAFLIYYYNKDSVVYFRNYCYNLTQGAGLPKPYHNFYLTSYLKKL
jgi:hypothetical protein